MIDANQATQHREFTQQQSLNNPKRFSFSSFSWCSSCRCGEFLIAIAVVAGWNCLIQAQEPRVELRYPLGRDSFRQDGVPQGKITTHVWKDSKVFPGTIRRYYVYVPTQYDASKPAALMVFQDGHTYINEDGDFRVPIVFDNLIHKGDMPVTIGVFVDPGHKKDELAAEARLGSAAGESQL